MNPQSWSVSWSPSRTRRFLAVVALIVIGCLAALSIAEVILRLVPIPGVSFHSFYYDPVTSWRYYPNTALIYRSPRGIEVRRYANSWGYPDVEHALTPAPGTLRIAFFGDSFTEARQVPLEETFFRLIDGDLNARIGEISGGHNRRGEAVQRFEAISFGISGRGTLQAYLECMQWIHKVDLDVVVYVFVENDPGDQIPRLKGSDEGPFPVLAGDSFVVDNSFNDRYGYKTSWWHRAMQRIKSNSLVVSTIEGRLKLLKRYGIKGAMGESDPAGNGDGGGVVMAPSKWPPELVEEGWTLVERVLDRWHRDVAAQGRAFMIVRVPREEMVGELLAGQDSWAPRLHDYCERSWIPLVDPTSIFAPHVQEGEMIYDDHFTPLGHRLFAAAFVSYWLERTGE